MRYYAKIENNIVVQVIIAEQDFVNTLDGQWIETSYNSLGNVNLLGGNTFRKNFASIGYTYDSVRDAFIPPKPNENAILDEDTCLWILNE